MPFPQPVPSGAGADLRVLPAATGGALSLVRTPWPGAWELLGLRASGSFGKAVRGLGAGQAAPTLLQNQVGGQQSLLP